MNLETEHVLKVLFAFLAGALLGIEREYRSKPAGFRTMILIAVGSCLFSMLSITFEANADRIASNIVTGIGFIGAGVIFKEGLNVRGITSAATIWMAAAIGMCIGFGHYILAAIVVALVLATLIVLTRLEEVLDNLHQLKQYIIRFKSKSYSVDELESEMKKMNIYFVRYKLNKQDDEIVAYYKIESGQTGHDTLNRFLISNEHIAAFEV